MLLDLTKYNHYSFLDQLQTVTKYFKLNFSTHVQSTQCLVSVLHLAMFVNSEYFNSFHIIQQRRGRVPAAGKEPPHVDHHGFVLPL